MVAQFRSGDRRNCRHVYLYADGGTLSHVDPHNPDADPWMFVLRILCDWWLAPLRSWIARRRALAAFRRDAR